ncbi:MAG: GNAT family N-acetyltransferase [Pseudomonadales bacterium]|nr:GNAT family N-acetyltransferase [Pseudomonadales bacterium]NRA17972.1 GNAT family N-acetyltransferase [Oceanospirillaceae bacterium]
MNTDLIFRHLAPDDFDAVIKLATQVHGEGYIDAQVLKKWFSQGIFNEINASFVVFDDNNLIGYRITFSATQWSIDKWCTPVLWDVEPDKVCYFKCNTVTEAYRGLGIGPKLLALSSQAVQEQGALAGIAHLWQQSPGNSAVNYFTKCGARYIKTHPSRWNEDCKTGYICTICGDDCHCDAQEMLIEFATD